jgi:hypothetical protein
VQNILPKIWRPNYRRETCIGHLLTELVYKLSDEWYPVIIGHYTEYCRRFNYLKNGKRRPTFWAKSCRLLTSRRRANVWVRNSSTKTKKSTFCKPVSILWPKLVCFRNNNNFVKNWLGNRWRQQTWPIRNSWCREYNVAYIVKFYCVFLSFPYIFRIHLRFKMVSYIHVPWQSVRVHVLLCIRVF